MFQAQCDIKILLKPTGYTLEISNSLEIRHGWEICEAFSKQIDENSAAFVAGRISISQANPRALGIRIA